MEKNRHTQGKVTTQLWEGWEADQKKESYYIGTIQSDNGQAIYAGPSSFNALQGATPAEAVANVHLIVEAFNVANETGYTPRQLLDRVKELELLVRTANDLLQHHQTEERKILPGYTLAANLGGGGTSLSNAITGYFIKHATPLT